MNNDEKLKTKEIYQQNKETVSTVTQSLSLDQVEKIFLKESEMLHSLDGYINNTLKSSISNKIERQKQSLLEIVKKSLKIQETIDTMQKPVIDNKYFNKESLDINNI